MDRRLLKIMNPNGRWSSSPILGVVKICRVCHEDDANKKLNLRVSYDFSSCVDATYDCGKSKVEKPDAHAETDEDADAGCEALCNVVGIMDA